MDRLEDIAAKTARLERIMHILSSANPNPQSELIWHNPYELLVAVMLSAHTTDRSVNAVLPALLERAPSPRELARMSIEDIEGYIHSIGLYHNKAHYLKDSAAMLAQDYNNEVPTTLGELIKLPGVGVKTASVVLNVAFGVPTIPVDTHIYRVAHRLDIAPGGTPNIVQKQLEAIVPAQYKKIAHHLLLLHGRYICTARAPHCGKCPITDYCPYPNKGEGSSGDT